MLARLHGRVLLLSSLPPLLPRRCLQATFVALAAAAAVDPTSPLGLALVVGVPTLGIFLVSAFLLFGSCG